MLDHSRVAMHGYMSLWHCGVMLPRFEGTGCRHDTAGVLPNGLHLKPNAAVVQADVLLRRTLHASALA